MSTATRVPLTHAEAVAREIVPILGLGCERIAVAGSIRRRRPDVGDIEIVAVPRVHLERLRVGFFEDREVTIDELQVVLDTLLMDGTLMAHPTDPKRGPRYSKLMHVASGIQVDLFSARPDTFGVVLLIRTGSADYSHTFVTQIRGRGWHVGGGAELHRGALACADRVSPCDVVPTPEERDVYAAVGLTWIEPGARS